MTQEKIAVFGSAFNPPSLGHASVIARLDHFDSILLVPSYAHAWGKQMLDFYMRCDLIERFIADLEQQDSACTGKVQLCRLEEDIYTQNGGDSVTTYALLQALSTSQPQAEFTFVLGPDNLLAFNKFAHAKEILENWSVLACPQTLDVRSTYIRDLFSQAKRPDIKALHALTTKGVAQALLDSDLY